MPKRFYAAWAIAVILAVVLPIAVPYFIWLPREGNQPAMVANCGRRAEVGVINATHPVASILPLSSSVTACESNADGFLVYLADVDARGPYGIVFASGEAGRGTVTPLNISGGGLAAGFAALLGGIAAVSAPFVLALRRGGWLRDVVHTRS